MTVELRRRVVGYAYPRNGNVDNPTPRVVFEVWQDGRLVDHSYRLRDLRKDWPEARLVRSLQG